LALAHRATYTVHNMKLATGGYTGWAKKLHQFIFIAITLSTFNQFS